MGSALAALVVIGALLGGCGNGKSLPPQVAVQLSFDTEFEPGRLTVRGQSDLPNGAVFTAYIWSEQDPTRDQIKEAALNGQQFVVIFDIPSWKGPLNISVAMLLDGKTAQPRDIVELVGPRGDYLTGPNIRTSEGGFRYVERSVQLLP